MTDRTVRNTAADHTANPLAFLAASLGGGGVSQAIEEQERAGQAELINSTVLPTDLNGDTREDFEALGFVFGEVVEGDPLFQQATLPAGWSRKGSDHDMWSHIVDERGVERVAVFYKAAFYDRKAHMDIVNVGYQIANRFIYGAAETPELHPDLTGAELTAVQATALGYLERAEERPDIYGDRAPRAKALSEAVAAR